MNNSSILYEQLSANLPKLHCWEGEYNHGGFDLGLMDKLHSFLQDAELSNGGKVFMETGAGLSTLLFLCCNPKSVVTCTLEDSEFINRLMSSVKDFNLPYELLALHIGHSEKLLPKIVLDGDPYVDFFLIDGGHGWPTVFVDFCYAYYSTKQYGYIVLDDTQLYSVGALSAFLKEQPGLEVALDLGKTIIFKKIYIDRHLPDFGGQPYIKRQSF
jgi:hypothetical protein